jgi:magnesium transporter
MYYQIQDKITSIDLSQIDPEILTTGIITVDELDQCSTKFAFSETTVAACKNHIRRSHGGLEVYDNYLFGIMFGINEKQIIRIQDRIGFFIKSNLFLIVVIQDQDGSVQKKFSAYLDQMNTSKITLEKLIFGFFERMITDDYAVLEKIEDEISSHEDRIDERQLTKDFNFQNTEIRKKLLLLDNYYQQLIAFGEELEENTLEIFNTDRLHYFRTFTNRAIRLSDNTRMLQEYSVHVREEYYAQLDNDLNNIMKLFTVVTTIFLPLTLIVGWYGMNFKAMPELTWKYGYLFVTIMSVTVVILCIIYFKKKKFL